MAVRSSEASPFERHYTKPPLGHLCPHLRGSLQQRPWVMVNEGESSTTCSNSCLSALRAPLDWNTQSFTPIRVNSSHNPYRLFLLLFRTQLDIHQPSHKTISLHRRPGEKVCDTLLAYLSTFRCRGQT